MQAEGGGGTTTPAEPTNLVRQAKEGVLLLLQHVLPTAPPNLAHFLLGYSLTDDVSTTCCGGIGSRHLFLRRST